LNCGTGEDAVYFANNGHHVHATDLSTGMLQALRVKIDEYDLKSRITYEQCSFTQLDQLNECGPFDMVFSNFGGLNCTGELHKVLQSLEPFLKPGGVVTLVVISDFSLWETLLLFKGKWKTAMRRWFRKNGAEAKVEGQPFRCWYYSPNYVEKCLKTYSLLSLEGLCTLVPPSYMENFHQKHARMYQWLKKKEEKLKSSFPWNRIGDYFIITLQKPL
jgi:ubiquinone/menaquinone biosynthesis C-methylase UbiE